MEHKFFAVFWSAVMLAMGVLKTIAVPGGSILMRFNSLQNAENKNYEGKCCDGTSRSCQPCEYKFKIWVTCDGKRNDTDCFHGYSETGIFPRTSRIIFNETLGNGLPNPLVYNFSLFRGTFGFQILATDRHGSKINDYTYKIPYYPKIYSKKKWINLIQTAQGLSGSKLNLNYSIHCNPHYYGPSCVVGCPPGNNYRCDPSTGNKLCSGGWIGPNCDCRMTSKNTCDATGKKICYRPWYGDNCDIRCEGKNDATSGYTCDVSTGDKVCLAGWYGNECDQTTPVAANVSTVASNDALRTHIPNVNTFTSTPTREILPSFSTPVSSEQTRILLERSTLGPFSRVLITWIGTDILLHKTSRNIRATAKVHSVNTHPISTSNSFSSPLVKTSIKRAIGTIVKLGDRTEVLQILPLTVGATIMAGNPTTLEGKSNSVTRKPFEGLDRETVKNRDHTEELQSPPLTIEATATVANPTPLESNPNTVRERSFEGPAGKTVNVGGQTDELQSLPPTMKATAMDEYPTPFATKPFRQTHTWSLVTFTDKPGSSEARKSQQIWWMVLVPFIAIALLVVAGVVIFKNKERKSRKVSPQNEIPLEKIEQQAQDKYRCETDHNDNSSLTQMASDAQEENMNGELLYKVL